MLDKLQQHDELMSEMLDRTGADCSSPARYREAFLRCCLCERTQECKSFLERTEGTQTEAPGFCRNKRMFDGE